MSLTPEELERRRNFITATDVPAIIGVSPWANAADVFASKVYGVDKPTNEAMRLGSRLEAYVLDWANEQLGPIQPGDWCVAENGINACTTDARLPSGELVEAKTSGINGPGNPHQWGDEGTDEVPDYYILQAQAQMFVTGAPCCYMPALIGGRGFVMYVIKANAGLHEAIDQHSREFWESHVLPRQEPPNVRAHLETFKHMRREPGKTVAIADDLVAEYLLAKTLAKDAADKEDAAKAALLAQIADAEAGVYSGGTLTYYQQTTNYKAREASTTTFRVLRHKAAKKDKSNV